MAYFTLKAYDADVFLTSFLGLNQAGDGVGMDIRYAMEAKNVETPFGVLQPQAATEVMETGFTAKIETLAKLHRRWYTGTGSKDWLFAASGGKIFYKHAGTEDAWAQLAFPTGVTAYQNNVWSYVSYEINPAGSASSVDVLLISNADDGMFMITPPYTATMSQANWTVTSVNTQGYKFGVIERYAERIWGGAIPDEPDKLVYSRPFDPTDWTPAGVSEEPEDGAGDINQPSWDGDSFTALRSFGSQLIGFKKNRVWRILGTDPGEYTFKEQFGGGTPYFNTISVDVERIWMADRNGLEVYDGLSVTPYNQDAIARLWSAVNKDAMDQMCGVLYKENYYLSIPTGSSAKCNDLIIFNLKDNTILYYTDTFIESFLATDDDLLYTSSTVPGKILKFNYDSWKAGKAANKPTKWVTPWIDFSRKSYNKGGFEVYFSPEVKDFPVTFRFSIETEKKMKSKTVVVQPTIIKAKQKRIRFGGTGRKFRLHIETLSSNAVWRLTGGIQMVVETDPD